MFSHICTFLLQGGLVSVLSARQSELTAQTADTRPEAGWHSGPGLKSDVSPAIRETHQG
ncbi:TPA: hypothetical protein ACGAD2_005303 [Salmonella enterica subsp. enterica serovar Newport]